MKVISREDLVGRPEALAPPASPESVIWQTSSGTTSEVLRVPRTRPDLDDTVRRVTRPYRETFGAPPARAALLGGVSHAEVAARWQSGEISIASFTLENVEALDAFAPDLLSCYPSILRELLDDPRLSWDGIRAVKLGGERVHRADVERIAQRLPGVPVIEQYGSTELPALALRVHRGGPFSEPFGLETGRFSFLLGSGDGWHDLVARDGHPEAPPPFRSFYDTGDEVLVRAGAVVDVRRRGDPANEWHALAESLLRRGCTQVQVDPLRARVEYTGPVTLPATLAHGGAHLATRRRKRLVRDASNKLPLVVRTCADG